MPDAFYKQDEGRDGTALKTIKNHPLRGGSKSSQLPNYREIALTGTLRAADPDSPELRWVCWQQKTTPYGVVSKAWQISLTEKLRSPGRQALLA